MWSKFPDFQTRIRDAIVKRQALDRIMIGFNGTHRAKTSDHTVIEGCRTVERQRELVKDSASQTMNSRHLTGHAVDIVPLPNGKVSWEWKYFYPMADAMKQAAAELGIAVEWGGNWTTFKDGPHFQLPARQYPG
ncbi:phage major capsid, P2 family protein [Yersinia enterocolitica]|nr:phage major capsid, P2 family protein [Yersinia enterocolitica]